VGIWFKTSAASLAGFVTELACLRGGSRYSFYVNMEGLMKTSRVLILLAVAALVAGVSSVVAAPVESVESSRASAALQKVDAFLGEEAVAKQLTAMGLTHEQASARLAQLSDAQLEQLAAQVDLIKSGGMIQDGGVNRLGPIGCFLQQVGTFFTNIIRFVFCWTGPK
jgi:hypothetical protein